MADGIAAIVGEIATLGPGSVNLIRFPVDIPAARAENLGLGMVSILNPREIELLLAVPEGWEFAAYLCIGHPEFMDDTPLLHRNGWQENGETDWPVL